MLSTDLQVTNKELILMIKAADFSSLSRINMGRKTREKEFHKKNKKYLTVTLRIIKHINVGMFNSAVNVIKSSLLTMQVPIEYHNLILCH